MGVREPDGPWSTDGIPDLPPEWGRVVVPDDASALAQEAAQVRRELHEAHRSRRLRRLRTTLTRPVLILVLAMLTLLAGLVTVWPGAEQTATPSAAPVRDPLPDPVGRPLPALDLVDADQAPVPLRSLVPAVILLLDGCACPERVTEAAQAAPAGVQVVAVVGGRTAPVPAAEPAANVRHLGDPADGLRALMHANPVPGTVDAILVDRAGTVVRVVPATTSVEDYRTDLAHVTG